jgi:hypothetical protein
MSSADYALFVVIPSEVEQSLTILPRLQKRLGTRDASTAISMTIS